MSYFRNKCAIVTGGASGIGRSLCEHLGRCGAMVTVADIDGVAAERVASAIREKGGRGQSAQLDVAQAQAVQDLVTRTTAEHGRLDCMINNAGFAVGGELFDIDLELWQRIIQVNLMGVVYGTAAAYRVMVEQGSGQIVNVSSVSGLLGHPTGTPYATSKAGIVGLSQSLRAEAAGLGVKINLVCPGFIRTGFFDSAVVVNARPEDVLSRIPFKMMSADRAAEKILLGVERNKAFIVFPLYARVLWWLYRIHPSLLKPIAKKMVNDFRAVRTTPMK